MNTESGKILILVCVIATISFFLVDFYLPSMPAMRQYFHGGGAGIKLIVGSYLLGLGFSQLIFGTISDRFGRKLPLLVGISIAAVANYLLTFSPNITTLLFFRMLSGFGAGVCPPVVRAILSDKFSGHELLKANSYLSMSITMSPAIAPVLGGFIEQYVGWKANVAAVSLWAVIVFLLIVFFLQDTLKKQHAVVIDFSEIKKRMKIILSDTEFSLVTVISSFAIAANLSYFILTPFIFQTVLHISPAHNGIIISCSRKFTFTI